METTLQEEFVVNTQVAASEELGSAAQLPKSTS